MPNNTSTTNKSTSENAERGLVESDEAKLEKLKEKLTIGKAQADKGETIDGEEFICDLIAEI